MNNKFYIFTTVLISSLLDLPDASGEIEHESCLQHFYGSKSRPGIEISIEDDGVPEDQRRSDFWFSVTVFKDNGVEERASSNLPDGPCEARETETGWEITGTTRMHGHEIGFRAIVSRDRSALEVLEPKAVVLADGTKLPLAGRYADLSEKVRANGAKPAFQVIDKQLNSVYRKVMTVLDSAAVDELRVEQRRWLRYRDYVSFDRVDGWPRESALVIRQQSIRTLERIAFLRTFLSESRESVIGDALYSNGRGVTYAVGRLDGNIVFSSAIDFSELYFPEVSACSLELNGVARPDKKNIWLAKPEDFFFHDRVKGNWSIIPLKFRFDSSGRLHVQGAREGSSEEPLVKAVGGTYRRLRALVPAEEPMRSLLIQLPQMAFGDAADGFHAAGRKALATGRESGAFKLEKEARDRLVLKGPDGKVRILRMAGADGSAVVAVEQMNHRPPTMLLWKKARAGEKFIPLKDTLPRPPIERFFDKELGEKAGKIREVSTYVYNFDHGQGIGLSLKVSLDGTLPDYYFSIDWDGYGFHFNRRAR